MLFDSAAFLAFLPAVLLLVHASPARARTFVLLLASYAFYMAWEPAYAGLIAASTAVDFVAAQRIAAAARPRSRRAWLALSLTANLGLLFTFKYLGFFARSVAAVAALAGAELHPAPFDLLLPVGISFYTFQTLSYTVDVYRGALAPERSWVRFALYVAFFPQLVAGPIERAGRLLPQLHGPFDVRLERVLTGGRLALWGLFKKVVIADRAGVYVDAVFARPEAHGGAAQALAALLFAVQIYGDFSGYSDVAIGTARMLGVDLMRNFRQPYLATSVGDFWRRWHVSLSTWFRDYVYLPLGGNRGGPWRAARSLLVVFAVSGLWHGARWTFVVWGLWHGAALVAERFAAPRLRALAPGALGRLAGRAWTLAVVLLGWVWFRADDLGQATAIFEGLAVRLPAQLAQAWADGGAGLRASTLTAVGFSASGLALVLALAGALAVADGLAERGVDLFDQERTQAAPAPGWGWARLAAVPALAFGILWLGLAGERPFLYFQF